MENTPRNVILQVGSLIALYLTASFLLTLVFGLINITYPSPSESYWEIESATESIRLGIAMIIVFFPTYLVLTRLMNRYRRVENGALYQNITKWLIYLSLLIGGLVLLGTLVTTIHAFLNGDLTTRFLLKAGAVLVVVGMAFHYYLLDVRGFWVKEERKSVMFGVGAVLLVFLAIAFGLKNIETPSVVREMKLDEAQINDLRNIQYQVESFMVLSSSTLPATLDVAYQDVGMNVPAAPEGREDYTYEKTDKGFKLCATFSRSNVPNEYADTSYIDPAARIKNPENWNYKEGRYCFERVVK
ncbi:MAG: hypothetical protein KBD44_00665 [Candidatus Pacebacteria bacterium]|nr:hypothetical protein [Candidatus Paceibacterota bacterium]